MRKLASFLLTSLSVLLCSVCFANPVVPGTPRVPSKPIQPANNSLWYNDPKIVAGTALVVIVVVLVIVMILDKTKKK